MTLENPFFVVKDEVCKALNKNRGLYGRWTELQDVVVTSPTVSGGIPISRDELEWTTTELRKALRSIEWDLDDLEDTIRIVEKNPTKFKIDNKELTVQRSFIEQTREEVKIMKDKMNLSRGRDRDNTARQPLLDNSPARVPVNHGTTKYSKLENEIDSPNRQFLGDTLQQQNDMMRQQDEQLDMIGESIGTLKTVSRQINTELDEQAVMLDEFGNELEVTDSKLDATMKKMAKVLHMSNGGSVKSRINRSIASCETADDLVAAMLLIEHVSYQAHSRLRGCSSNLPSFSFANICVTIAITRHTMGERTTIWWVMMESRCTRFTKLAYIAIWTLTVFHPISRFTCSSTVQQNRRCLDPVP